MNEVSKLIDRTITEVVFDSTVTSIGNYAFFGCSNLKELHFTNPTPPTIVGWPWYGLKYVYVPEGSVEAYRTAFIDKIHTSDSGGVAIDPSTFVFTYQVPYWEEQSFECEVDETGTKTGMVTVVEKDTNPSSPSYNQTRSRTYEDLKRCNPVSGFTKITSLDEATSGKYLIVDIAKNIALNASLITSTTSGTNGINANSNYISVDIDTADDTIEATETTLNAAVDYDGNYLTWTDENSGTVYYLSQTSSAGSTFKANATASSSQINPFYSYDRGFTFKSEYGKAIALFTNSSGSVNKFRWQENRSVYNMALFKLN